MTHEKRIYSGGAEFENDYWYDAVGNRTKLVDVADSSQEYRYYFNDLNQLTHLTKVTAGTSTDYSYDANGNLTKKAPARCTVSL